MSHSYTNKARISYNTIGFTNANSSSSKDVFTQIWEKRQFNLAANWIDGPQTTALHHKLFTVYSIKGMAFGKWFPHILAFHSFKIIFEVNSTSNASLKYEREFHKFELSTWLCPNRYSKGMRALDQYQGRIAECKNDITETTCV